MNCLPTYKNKRYNSIKEITNQFLKSSSFASSSNQELNGTSFTNDQEENIYSMMNTMFFEIIKEKGDNISEGTIRTRIMSKIATYFKDNANNHTQEQRTLILDALDEIKNNDKFWQAYTINLTSIHNFDIKDVEENTDEYLTKSWDDSEQFKKNPATTVADEIKLFINSTQIVNPNQKILVDGKFTYKSNIDTPTGFPNTLNWKFVANDLYKLMQSCKNIDEMLTKLQTVGEFGNTAFHKTLTNIWNILRQDKNLQIVWFTTFDKAILDSYRDLMKKNEIDGYEINIDVSNKNKAEYILANAWQNVVITRAENNYFTPDFLKQWEEDFYNVMNSTNNFKTLDKVSAEALAKLYNDLGIFINSDTILYTQQYSNNFKSKIISPLLHIKGVPSYKGTKEKAYIDNRIANKNFKFNEFGNLFRLAESAKIFTDGIISYSNTNVKGNMVYDPQNHGFLTALFTKIQSGDKNAYDTIIDYTKVLSNQHSFFLWGDQYLSINDTTPLKEGYGVLNFIIENGVKIPLPKDRAINTENLSKFNVVNFEGSKDLNTGVAQEYRDLAEHDWTLRTMLYYLSGSKKEGNAMFPLLTPSDRNTTKMLDFPKLKLTDEEYDALYKLDEKVIKDSRHFKEIRNTILDEMIAMKVAKEILFELDEHGIALLDDGQPIVKKEVHSGKFATQMFYHYNLRKDDSRDFYNGNVFNFYNLLVNDLSLNDFTFFDGSSRLNLKDLIFINSDLNTLLNRKYSYRHNQRDESYPLTTTTIGELLDNFTIYFMSNQLKQARNTFGMYETIIKNSTTNRKSTNTEEYNNSLINTKFGTAITEYALNTYLNNIEQFKLFHGSIADYKSRTDVNKRGGQIIANGISNTNVGEFTAATISDIKIKSRVYEHIINFNARAIDFNKKVSHAMVERLSIPNNEANLKSDFERQLYTVVKPYLENDSANATSLITFDEFVNRITGFGKYNQYKDIIDKIKDGIELKREDYIRFATMQKNFYYDYRYNESLGKFVPVQIKNAEIVLTPDLVADLELDNIVNAMKETGVVQINLGSAEKVGTFNISTIADDNGRLIEYDKVIEGLNFAKRQYNYENLRMQLEVPDHILDEVNRLAVQLKKAIDNISLDNTYNIGDKKVTGFELKNQYFDIISENVISSAKELLQEFGVDLDTNGNPTGKIDISEISKRLVKEAIARGLSKNMIYSLTLNDEGNTILPLCFNQITTKVESILTSFFTNNVTRQKFPGIHVTQMANLFMNPSFKKEGDLVTTLTKKVSKNINWHKDIENREDRRLKSTILSEDEHGKVIEAEVLLPRWSKLFYKNGEGIDINTLSDEVRIMIGYRIPTEAKYSMYIFKVVGFLPDVNGASIVLPDDFVTQTGSDFDIDSVYTMAYNLYKKGDKILTKKFTEDIETIQDRYDDYINSSLDISGKRFKVLAKQEITSENDKVWNSYKDNYKDFVNEEVSTYYLEEKDRILNWNRLNKESFDTQFRQLGNEGKRLFSQLDISIKEDFWTLEESIRDYDGVVKNQLYAQEAQMYIDNVIETDPNIAILKELLKVYNKTNEIIGISNKFNDSLKTAFKLLEQNTKEYSKLVKEKTDEEFIKNLSKIKDIQKEISSKIKFEVNKVIANNIGLLSPEEFSKLPTLKQNSKKARENQLINIYYGILSNRQHYNEITVGSKFTDITNSKVLLETIQQSKNVGNVLEKYHNNELIISKPKDISNTTFDGQFAYRKRVREGAELKAISVSLDNFVSIAQHTNIKIKKENAITVDYSIEDNNGINVKLEKRLIKEFGGDRITKNGKQYVRVIHEGVGNNLIGNFKNVNGKLITTYSAQTTTNILDNVKDPIPNNVNPYTFGIWKLFATTGSTYDVATLFINQPVLIETSEYYFRNKNNENKNKEINKTKSKYQTLLYQVMKKNGASINSDWDKSIASGKNIFISWNKEQSRIAYSILGYKNGESIPLDITELANNIKVTDEKEIKDLLSRKSNETEIAKLNTERIKSTDKVKIQELSDKIDILTQQDNNIKTRLQQIEQHLRNQLEILETFKLYKKTSQIVTNINNVSNTDKIGAGPTFETTNKLVNDIYEFSEDNILTVDGVNPVKMIYPSMFGLKNESVYPTLEVYLKYSNLLCNSVFSEHFISQSPLYQTLKRNISDVLNNGNYNKELVSKFVKYLNLSLLKDNYWLNNISRSEINSLLGKNEDGTKTEIISNFDFSDSNNIDYFNTLSLANQILLYKDTQTQEELKNSILNYLDIRTTEQDFNHNGFYKVNYINNENVDAVTTSINNLWYSDNIFARILARNLVKYDYILNGFSYGYNTISKVIPNTIFAKETDSFTEGEFSETGIGLVSHLYSKLNLVNKLQISNKDNSLQDAINIVFNSDIQDTFIRSNWKDEMIVPDASVMTERLENGEYSRILQPDSETGIISISYDKFLAFKPSFVNQKIKNAPYIKLILITVSDKGKTVDYTLYKKVIDYATTQGESEETMQAMGTIYYYPVSKLELGETTENSYLDKNNKTSNGQQIESEDFYRNLINNYREKHKYSDLVNSVKFNPNLNEKTKINTDLTEKTGLELIRNGKRIAITFDSKSELSDVKVGQYINLDGTNEYIQVTKSPKVIDLTSFPNRQEWVKLEGLDVTNVNNNQLSDKEYKQFQFKYIGTFENLKSKVDFELDNAESDEKSVSFISDDIDIQTLNKESEELQIKCK